jgi:hypothetical protein
MQVKDEMAGKEGKCPSCGQLLVIPEFAAPAEAEEEASSYLLADEPEEKQRPQRDARYVPQREREDEPPRRRPKLEAEERKRPSRPRRNEERRAPGVAFEEGWFGSINAGVAGGLLMMFIAVVWFIVGMALINRIFIFPPILFVIGLISLVKGVAGGE